jgi:hypothetical protein
MQPPRTILVRQNRAIPFFGAYFFANALKQGFQIFNIASAFFMVERLAENHYRASKPWPNLHFHCLTLNSSASLLNKPASCYLMRNIAMKCKN